MGHQNLIIFYMQQHSRVSTEISPQHVLTLTSTFVGSPLRTLETFATKHLKRLIAVYFYSLGYLALHWVFSRHSFVYYFK
jgi:hypothetical protein